MAQIHPNHIVFGICIIFQFPCLSHQLIYSLTIFLTISNNHSTAFRIYYIDPGIGS